MKESKTELPPTTSKVEQHIVPKRITHRVDFRLKTSILSAILNDSFGRAFDEYEKYVDHCIYEKNPQRYEQTTQDFNACQ